MATADPTANTVEVKSNGTKSDLIEGFNNLNLVRQAGLMVGIAASVAMVLLLFCGLKVKNINLCTAA